MKKILDFHGNGSIVDIEGLKPTSSQAAGRRKKVHKLRAQASSLSQQAQGSRSQGTSVQPDPGHKLPGYRNFWDA